MVGENCPPLADEVMTRNGEARKQRRSWEGGNSLSFGEAKRVVKAGKRLVYLRKTNEGLEGTDVRRVRLIAVSVDLWVLTELLWDFFPPLAGLFGRG